MTDRLRGLYGIAVAVVLAGAPGPVLAQSDYPNRTIKIVVPVAPGGFADALPRLVAEKLSARWGHPVIIENRPGGALNIGAEAVAKAEPDGYTLLATPSGPLVTNQFLYPKLGFDPAAFVPVTVLASGPFLLVARPSLPASNLDELIAYAKAHPDKLNFGSTGAGSPPHLAGEMLKLKAGIRLGNVSYRGLTPALTDVVAGHLDLLFHDFASTAGQIKAGLVKVLAVGSEARMTEFPDVPAVAERYPGFLAGFWYGVMAPPKTPEAIAAKLSQAITETLKHPDIDKKLREFSVTPGGISPEETAAFMKQEAERWRQVIVAAGIKAE
jgi:tripartite-type tricarboxylate transporter receptor subunit TctC